MKNHMKKLIAMMTAALCVVMVGCGSTPATQATPEELATKYENAIIEARGGRENCQNFLTNTSNFDSMFGEDENLTEEQKVEVFGNHRDMTLDTMGLNVEDMNAFVVSASMINVRVDSIAIISPAEGKADTVKSALETYVANTQRSFEMYLADQYEIAKTATIETLGDGTIVLVMCEDGDAILQSIKTELAK